MIRVLIAGLEWLDKRFPPKVTVTKQAFEDLVSREHRRMKDSTAFRIDLDTQKERIGNIEKSVAALKEILVKSATPSLSEPARRAAFIASGRMGE